MHPIRNRVARLLTAATIMGGLVATGLPGTVFAADETAPEPGPYTVIAEGLNNPRGLAFDASGALFVAEAGLGGDTCVTAEVEGEEGTACVGLTGGITRIKDGVQTRILSNMPSISSDPSGAFAVGPMDVAPTVPGFFKVTTGLDNSATVRAGAGDVANGLGRVNFAGESGYWWKGSDLATFAEANNPDGGDTHTDPISIISEVGRDIVADAGSNDLVMIDALGNVSTLAVFPPQMIPVDQLPEFLQGQLPPGLTELPMESVPTSVVKGPDDAYYVGELTGFPFLVGSARVWRVVPGEEPTVYATGFTNIMDLSFDADGNLYVLELAKEGLLAAEAGGGEELPAGAIIKVTPDGEQSELTTEQPLLAPGGMTMGPDGALYVSNMSVLPGAGQVVRIAIQ